MQSLNLWLYFMIVFGVILLPGLDMAFIMASALLGGRRCGLVAVAGIIAGGVCYIVMAVLGLAVILKLWPALFNLVLLAGSMYIAWIGWSLLRSENAFRLTTGAARNTSSQAPASTFLQGMLTSLLNPKAYVFMLAIFPQFLKLDAGPIWRQALVLGLITWLTQAAVYGPIALLSGGVSGWFAGNPSGGAITGRLIGALLTGAAMFTGFEGWQLI